MYVDENANGGTLMHCELHPVIRYAVLNVRTTAEGNSKKYIIRVFGRAEDPATVNWLESISIQFLLFR